MKSDFGKIEASRDNVTSIIPTLTKSPVLEVTMAKKSLPNRNPLRKICSVPDCSMLVRNRDLCNRHYSHLLRKGDLILTRNDGVGDTPEERFWSRVNKDGPFHPHQPELGKCWLWMGSLIYGYGQLDFLGKHHRSHRVSYFLTHKQWPLRMVLHSCDRRSCVNPVHLREGTSKDNAADKILHGNHQFGENHGRAKLTAFDIPTIRSSSEGDTHIARKYGVTVKTIYDVRRRKTWKHV